MTEIKVSKTFLPPLEEYQLYLDRIWASGWVTNNGPLLRELEEKVIGYLGASNFLFCSNGTVVLQLALRMLDIKGEVITTPFSYVATTSSIIWEGCQPVFADVKDDCTIDPECIERLITPSTKAILATHVYGMPCDVEAIDRIARRHKLKVIYDAAHAFGTVLNGKQLSLYGDVATLSFHATKIFHTIEGGGLVTNDSELAARLKLGRSFGQVGDQHFTVGINAKNSEFHAAIGLCLLPRMQDFIAKRRRISKIYNSHFKDTCIRTLSVPAGVDYNYAYYPVFFESENDLQKVRAALESSAIYPRRYFFPSLNTLPYVQYAPCPKSEQLANTVLCLPLYYELADEDVFRIIEIVKNNLAK